VRLVGGNAVRLSQSLFEVADQILRALDPDAQP
jgi:hypothetical protein